MIFFDVETTGLILNEAVPFKLQPRIIEIGAVKCGENLKVIDTFETFLNPGGPVSEEITRITGITNEMLKDAPLFIEMYGALAAFFRGETAMAAHNARFDLMMLVYELQRCERQWNFPYCSNVLDTMTIYKGSLANWALEVKGAGHKQEHRALGDALLLRECFEAAQVPF